MYKRRLTIGALIGAFVFIVVSCIDKPIWLSLELKVLQLHSFFDLSRSLKSLDSSLFVLNIDKKTHKLLNEGDKPLDLNSEFGKNFFFGLMKDFSKYDAKSFSVMIKDLSQEIAEELDIEGNLGDLRFPVYVYKEGFIQYFEKINQKPYLLDPTKYRYTKHSLADLLTDKIQKTSFKDKNIVIISDFDDKKFLRTDLSLAINQIHDLWIRYVSFHPLFDFILFLVFGIACVSLVYWARFILLLVSSSFLIILSQFCFSVFDFETESIFLITSFALIFLLTSLTDLNFIKLRVQEVLNTKKSPLDISKALTIFEGDFNIPKSNELAETVVNNVALSDLQTQLTNYESKYKEIRNKFYCEQEDNCEALALEFQEKTVQSLVDLQTAINGLLRTSSLSEKDKRDLTLLKYDFDRTIDEFDALLFNLVPFQFESSKGLIDSLEILASKITYLAKGSTRVSVESTMPHLRLDLDIKINVYRILQKIIEIIVKSKSNNNLKTSNIIVGITEESDTLVANKQNRNVTFKVNYDGLAINKNDNFILREVLKRVGAIDAKLDFSADLENHNLTNKIELKIQTKVRNNPVGINN